MKFKTYAELYADFVAAEVIALVNKDKCIDILVKEDKLSLDDAMDYFHYNTVGAYVGEKTPLYLKKYE